ncbi:hypothetical protein ACEXOS_015080 [Herbiconiux sp. P16]|uniref:hypothetical protein n=1 Tax=Herbiconiux wuyangfengii TaxID=3342794 RepID=UPI0035BACCBD
MLSMLREGSQTFAQVEAKEIFANMKAKVRIGRIAQLSGVFIARSAGAALEMNL